MKKTSVMVFALQVALAAGSGVASATTLDFDFPDADENGYEEADAPATPPAPQHLVAAPVEVRLIPMVHGPAPVAQAAPAPEPPEALDADDASD